MKLNWEKYLLFKSKMSAGNIYTSIWSLQMVSFTWFYFAILFIIFEIHDRWTQFSLEDSGESEEDACSLPGNQVKVKRWYTIRLRSDLIDPSYPVDNSSSIHVKFFYFREKLGQFILPINSLRKYGQTYTNQQGNKYLVILIHWNTFANLINIDEIRIAHSSDPESPEIYLHDLDVREAELKIRIHCPIRRSLKAFPFVPGSTISLTPIKGDPESPNDFRSPYEKINTSEVIILMFVQSNVTQAIILWLPITLPNTSPKDETAFIFGLIFYSITTFGAIVVACYYQIVKIKLSPLKSTRLKRFRKLFIITSCLISSLFLLVESILATKYPPFNIKFWIIFALTGHALQALVIYFVYYWYKGIFSLELTGKEKTTRFLWFRFKTNHPG
ncbi:uncharacterized protein LOC128393747 [Panonychus citri]|uniref:uncharacterized protein LOC128393747 n=1 Tax=Panonychus citri TaxID=50023 RepID=UPI0023078994|nr:uncharacterized protein LOC128393747 [Panonychus citri]